MRRGISRRQPGERDAGLHDSHRRRQRELHTGLQRGGERHSSARRRHELPTKNALTSMNTAFATQPPGENNAAFFLSDGFPTTFSTGPGTPLGNAADQGTTIFTYAIGPAVAGACSAGEPLRVIAEPDRRHLHGGRRPGQPRLRTHGNHAGGDQQGRGAVRQRHAVIATLNALGNFSATVGNVVPHGAPSSRPRRSRPTGRRWRPTSPSTARTGRPVPPTTP